MPPWVQSLAGSKTYPMWVLECRRTVTARTVTQRALISAAAEPGAGLCDCFMSSLRPSSRFQALSCLDVLPASSPGFFVMGYWIHVPLPEEVPPVTLNRESVRWSRTSGGVAIVSLRHN
jgi:hypothetical protein